MTLESETETEADTEKDKRVCFRCVGEAYLKGEMKKSPRRSGSRNAITAAKPGASISVGELTGYVDAAFDKHFERTATGPDDMEYAMMADREGSYYWERQGSPVADVIGWEAEVSEKIAEDIRRSSMTSMATMKPTRSAKKRPMGAIATMNASRSAVETGWTNGATWKVRSGARTVFLVRRWRGI